MAVDLTTEIKTPRGILTLRNPFLPGSSEVAVDDVTVKRCIDYGFGGVLTKSVGNTTSPWLFRVYAKPWSFPLTKFGPDLRNAWLFHGASFIQSEDNAEKVCERRLPKWKKWAHDAGIPLIVSIVETADEAWPSVAKMVDAAAPDAIEMDASCPIGKIAVFKEERLSFSEDLFADPEYGKRIIGSVMKATKLPVGAKMSLYHNPPAVIAKSWEEGGLSFISGHNALPAYGIFIDIEKEEVFGEPGTAPYTAGPSMVPLSLDRLAHVLKAVKVPVIGLGGIFTPMDAIQYLLLGCTAVEVCSGVYFKGHKIVRELTEGLTDWMNRHGYTRIDQFRGKVLEEATCSRDQWGEKYGYELDPDRGMLLADLEPSPIVPKFNMEKCTLCDVCDDICLYGTIRVDHENKTLKIDEDTCIGCGTCVGICPENPGALWLEDKRTGEIVWDNSGGMSPVFKKRGFRPLYTIEERDKILRERQARK